MNYQEALTEIVKAKAEGRAATLRWASLSEADLHGADLRGATLRWADLRGANLSGANLRTANLSGANLRMASLSGADLRWASLSEADLHGADLRGATLRWADLRGANLSGATGNLREVRSIHCFERVVSYTATHIFIGCQTETIDKWFSITDAELNEMSSVALERWRKWEPIIKAIITMYPATPTGKEA